MDSFGLVEETVSPVAPCVEFTRLPDIELYLRDTASTGVTLAFVGSDWTRTIARLSEQFADVVRRDLALAVFATYVARMSENGEAVFPLKVTGSAASIVDFAPCSIALAPEDRFEDVLHKVLRTELHAFAALGQNDVSHPAAPHTFVVTAGAKTSLQADAQLQFHCHDDGAIDLWHANNISPEAAALIVERMIALAEGIAADPAKPLVRQPIMSARERKLVVQDWNATDKAYGYDGGLVAMMERAVEETPDHPALIYKDEELTFAEFDSRVNRMARVLRAKGVGKGHLRLSLHGPQPGDGDRALGNAQGRWRLCAAECR